MGEVTKGQSVKQTRSVQKTKKSPVQGIIKVIVEEPVYLEYELKRSKRKTVSISVTRELKILVKAPMRIDREKIDKMLIDHLDWTEKHIQIMKEINKRPTLSKEEYEECLKKAKVLVPERVEHFSKIMGVRPTGVKITCAESRWGSCGIKNNLCFSYILAVLPIELVDLIVVHELVHIIVKDHGNNFYANLEKYIPDYKQRNKELFQLQKNLPRRKK